MSDTTAIEWTNYTWSPWLGCRKVSPGCQNCYITGTPPFKFRKIQHGAVRVRTSGSYWNQPRAWNRNAARTGSRPRVFPSLCDPFDPEVPAEWHREFVDLISRTPYLTWLLLTKRPENIGKGAQLPPNVWLGVSVEDQQRADERIPILLSIPAKVRFLSVEPLLGPVDLTPYFPRYDYRQTYEYYRTFTGNRDPRPTKLRDGITWVIVGLESGPNRRDCGIEPLASIVDQCLDADVPCFVKQDCALKPGQQGRIPEQVWARKEFPTV